MSEAARPLIKVCGLTRAADVQLCCELGADMAGFIFHPESPRFVGPFFPETVPCAGLSKVGVFVRQEPPVIREIMDECGLDLAQLHGGHDEAQCDAVGPERVIKVLWPARFESAKALQAELDRFAPYCRYFLFDSGTSGGGHGETIELDILQQVDIPKDWFLAGGLSPDNVQGMVERCAPCGVDVNSGVESAPGMKDETRLRTLFSILNAAAGPHTEE